MSAISVYFAQGRNEIATGSYILPITQQVLLQTTSRISTQAAAQYLPSIAGNETAIAALTRAPQTISNPIYFQLFNLRPYTSQVAGAITLVGFIYVIILRLVFLVLLQIPPAHPFIASLSPCPALERERSSHRGLQCRLISSFVSSCL